ncbi:hypothetical protein JOB18_036713 [Solea senegalensis]|uniref:Protein FAM161A n=1 Tax=Solea senegalensis TaxID=28829 RepID=A0AAV6PJI2_SOLSE|nr:protein FAM161A [Solea senegalensis]KAG7464308.1 hypothetical protein JOB18_036713 [Solea senegalensis]
MEDCHRTNVLVTSCLKTPVDPETKAPLASYERERVVPRAASGHVANREHEEELDYDDSGSDFCDDDCRAAGERLDLSGIFFSNEEYYSKLEELKKAHLRTMAELESMYRRKLHLKLLEPGGGAAMEVGHRSPWSSPASSRRLRKSFSAVELRRPSASSHSSNEDEATANDNMEKEYVKNMWRNFRLSPNARLLSTSSLQRLPGSDQRRESEKKRRRLKDSEQENWKHRVTVPKPFHMTLREAERRRRGIKTRSEVELENTVLRRQLEELTECQRKFHATPVPAHAHLALYEERRRNAHEERRLGTVARPFSFLERERLKKQQKQQRPPDASSEDTFKAFKAKPVPRSVYAAASGELVKEEELYRSIKIQMRAQELLHSAALPRSALTRRLSQRKGAKDGKDESGFTHQPQINREVPDFDASYRRFQKHLEKKKEVKPSTACEPFALRTSHIPSHRQRILADIQKEQSSPRMLRWPHIGPERIRTPTSSLCSSLSGSLELLPAKVTDATKKRHEAVRKVLEQRKEAEEEEEQRRERQQQREKKLQRLVLKRAQANDPHLALSMTHHDKLTQFRKQALQRRREYQQEIKEIQQRVKQRPLLLEQVAQINAKQAAEKRYTGALRGCDVTEEFVSGKATKTTHVGSSSHSSGSKHSDRDDADDDVDTGYQRVCYRKVFLNDEDDPGERERERADDYESGEEPGVCRRSQDDECSGDNYHYSDDHESYSDESEHHADTGQQGAAE